MPVVRWHQRRYSRIIRCTVAFHFTLRFSFSLAKIRLHLRRRNFLMVSRRVVARCLAYRHVRALHRRVAMLRISARYY